MSRYLVDRIHDAPNIEVRTGCAVVGVRGTERLEAITVADSGSGESLELAADAVFVFIGAAPRTEMLDGLVTLDPEGFVRTGRDLMVAGAGPAGWTLDRDPFPYETSMPGVFAAGDVRYGSGKRVAAAVGEGSATIAMVHAYLGTV
jgi:thioredoxin reductase (NADPH)